MEDIFSESFTSQNQKRKRFSVEENKLLAKKVKDRPEIWNLQHKLHSNCSAIASAWESISKEINKSVEECKTAWKSLKDGKRYRSKKAKSGSAADLEFAEENPGPYWEYSDCMSFLATADSKRRTISSSSRTEDIGEESSSNYSFDNPKKDKSNLFQEAAELSSTVRNLITASTSSAEPKLKYMSMYVNLDRILQQLPSEIAEDLNMEFTTSAYRALKEFQKGSNNK